MVDFSLFTFCLAIQNVLGYKMFYCTMGVCNVVLIWLPQKWVLYKPSFLLNINGPYVSVTSS